MADERTIQEKIAAISVTKMPAARDLTLSDFVHTAGGWSHEIYHLLRELERGRARDAPGLLPAQGSGLRPAARTLQPQGTVSRDQGARKDRGADAEGLLVRGRSVAAGWPFFRDGKSRGRSAESVVARRESSSTPRPPSAGSCRAASSKRWPRCTISIGARPASISSACPGRARISPCARSRNGNR